MFDTKKLTAQLVDIVGVKSQRLYLKELKGIDYNHRSWRNVRLSREIDVPASLWRGAKGPVYIYRGAERLKGCVYTELGTIKMLESQRVDKEEQKGKRVDIDEKEASESI